MGTEEKGNNGYGGKGEWRKGEMDKRNVVIRKGSEGIGGKIERESEGREENLNRRKEN